MNQLIIRQSKFQEIFGIIISIQHLAFRCASRNEKEQRLSLSNGKLSCSCGDPTFSGIPCRHQLALVCKVKDVSFTNLVFNRRWEKAYFQETNVDQEPDELVENKEEEKKSNLEGDVSFFSDIEQEEVIQAFNRVNF